MDSAGVLRRKRPRQDCSLPCHTDSPSCLAAFLKGLSDKQREEHYFCKDFIKLKKIPTWKEMAKGRSHSLGIAGEWQGGCARSI